MILCPKEADCEHELDGACLSEECPRSYYGDSQISSATHLPSLPENTKILQPCSSRATTNVVALSRQRQNDDGCYTAFERTVTCCLAHSAGRCVVARDSSRRSHYDPALDTRCTAQAFRTSRMMPSSSAAPSATHCSSSPRKTISTVAV